MRMHDLILTRRMRTQLFTRAVEEAKELHDRRQGLKPATDHDPWDFLSPDDLIPSDDSDPEEIGGRKGKREDMRPPNATHEHAEGCSAREALRWLYLLAKGLTLSEVRGAFYMHVTGLLGEGEGGLELDNGDFAKCALKAMQCCWVRYDVDCLQ